MGPECLANNVLVGIKGQVTYEESVGRRVARITILLGAIVCTILWRSVGARRREVNVGDTAIDLSTLLSIKGSGRISRVGKLDISEALRTAGLLVSHDTGADKLTKFLKLAVQPLVVDVPAQVANEEVLDSSVFVDFGFLGRRSELLFSLALLGWLLRLLFAGVIRATIFVAVAVVVRGLLVLTLAGGGRVRVFFIVGLL